MVRVSLVLAVKEITYIQLPLMLIVLVWSPPEITFLIYLTWLTDWTELNTKTLALDREHHTIPPNFQLSYYCLCIFISSLSSHWRLPMLLLTLHSSCVWITLKTLNCHCQSRYRRWLSCRAQTAVRMDSANILCSRSVVSLDHRHLEWKLQVVIKVPHKE